VTVTGAYATLLQERLDSMASEEIYRWRGTEPSSLEVLRLQQTGGGISAHSTLSINDDPAYAVSYEWQLDEHWSTVWLRIRLEGDDERTVLLERDGETSWLVDGVKRPDLDGCEEIDLSVTPFCNSLALRRLGGEGELTALHVSFPDLRMQPSRQRYEKLGPRSYCYIDLGVASGFEARLDFDAIGMVTRYEGLFELLPDGL
jgi:hypothetical protein